ncbi:unnamed protein product [Brassica rapa subsp. narinosa]
MSFACLCESHWVYVDVTKKADPKAKALNAVKAVKSGKIIKKKAKKIRTKVTFHRPKTLTKARDPKVPTHQCHSKE